MLTSSALSVLPTILAGYPSQYPDLQNRSQARLTASSLDPGAGGVAQALSARQVAMKAKFQWNDFIFNLSFREEGANYSKEEGRRANWVKDNVEATQRHVCAASGLSDQLNPVFLSQMPTCLPMPC